MAIRGFYWRIRDFLQEKSPKPFNVIAGRDGSLYEIRDHLLGRLVTRKKEIRELDQITPGFELKLPKVPGDILLTAMSFFRSYCSEWEQNEVMLQLYYDRLNKTYFLECPYQTVSKARIEAEIDPVLMHNERFVQVMHIHSHNTMDAYFSSIDNEDEKAFMIYGVVGRLQFHEPDLLLRVGCNGEYITLPLAAVFDDPVLTPTTTGFPEKWHQRVQVMRGRR